MVRYLFYTIGDLTYQSPLILTLHNFFEGTKISIKTVVFRVGIRK